jgi:hypothetical protein
LGKKSTFKTNQNHRRQEILHEYLELW